MNDRSLYESNFCIEARWLIPINNNQYNKNNVLKDTAIVIEDQLIRDILPIEAARKKYQNLPKKELKNHAIMPGFINSHTHAPMNLLKGYADDLPLMTWLNEHIWPIENAFFSDEFAYDGAILAICEMLKSGTTCFNDMYFYSNSIAKAAHDLGMRANIGTHVFDFPSKWAKNIDEYLNKCLDVINEYQQSNLINPVVCPHAPYTVSDESFKKVINFSHKHNIPIGCHLHETLDEITQSLKEFNARPIARLNKLGLFDQNCHAIHMVHLNYEEMALIADKNISIAHCPESNAKLASGFFKLKEVLEYNINIGLGTDGAASNNDLDMLGEMRTAALIAKNSANDPTVLPDYQALELATINSAKLMGLETKIGSLTIGKEADIIAIDLGDYGSQPVYNPISSIVYTASRQQITDVWVKGIPKVENSNLVAIDKKKIQHIIDKWQDRITNFKK